MIVDILGYRDWAREIHNNVNEILSPDHIVHFHSMKEAVCGVTNVFAVGWSEIIPEDIYERQSVFILHPSPLPKYRGGSPIQHQLLAGEKVSAVTIFKLDKDHEEIDSGPICWQMPFSLEGNLDEIFERIVHVGARGILTVIEAVEDGTLAFLEQNEEMATVFKRRMPYQSEIDRTEITTWPAWKLDAKIRGLQDPYPNAFITCADGNKLYLTGSRLDD
jgi:methionyl-tRNA formyltransferase